MRRFNKIHIFFFSLVAFAAAGFITADDLISELTKKLRAFNSAFPQSKLYLAFNQPAYAPGDTAFFKAYLLTEELKPVKGRQVIYFTLVDEVGNSKIKESFTIDNGIAGNQTIIPKSFTPGLYKFVAYTNWMKNFSSELFFSKPFAICGEDDFSSQPVGDIQIELFAEGGKIVSEIQNRIVAFATQGGIPIAASGRIINDEGTEIIQFQCDKTGLAGFELTPGRRHEYTVEGANGMKIPIDVEQEGCVIKVQNEGELIKADIQLRSNTGREGSIYVILTSRSEIRYASMIRLKGNTSTSVFIPKRNLPEGIAQLALFDSNSRLLAKRIMFIDQPYGAQVDLSISGSPAFGTRSPISFEIDVKDQYGASKQTDLLVGAFHEDLFLSKPLPDFREQLLINCDVPDAQYFLEQVDINSEMGLAMLDMFLITKKEERFDWEAILTSAEKTPKFRAQGTLNYKGTASFRESGKPVPDSTLILFLLQNEIFGYEVYAKDGKFEWPVFFDFYGNDQVMYSMEYKGKRLENAVVSIFTDSLKGFRSANTVSTNKKNRYYAFSTITDVASTSFSYAWKGKDTVSVNGNPNAAFEDELSGADATMNVDDYVVFPTMEDLFREVVRFVQHRKIGGKATLRVLSSDSNNPIMGEPLCVVDGIPTRNIDFILSMKPAEIAVVKVVNNTRKLRTMGQITKNGVVFFQTKIADINSRIPKDDILNLRGFNKPVSFEMQHVTDSESPRTPYLKSSLYWKLGLERNERGIATGEFFTADNTGKVNVVVRGITADGIPFHRERTVDVRFIQANK